MEIMRVYVKCHLCMLLLVFPAYLSVCVCLSLCYLFISFYYGFVPDSNKWNGIENSRID